MNDWQLTQQLRYIIQQIEWSVGDPLFRDTNILIAPIDPYGALENQASYPYIIIRTLDKRMGPANRNRPDEIEYSIGLDIVHRVPGDKNAEASLLGRNQQAGTLGKGILEIEETLQASIEILTTKNGMHFAFVGASAAGADPIGEHNETIRRLNYKARGTRARFYNKPLRFRASNSSGTVTLTWTLPPTRYDTLRVEVWRHTSEITSYGQGTSIYSGTGTSTTNAPGAGTWYYAIFGIYVEPGSSTEKKSDPRNYRLVVS